MLSFVHISSNENNGFALKTNQTESENAFWNKCYFC